MGEKKLTITEIRQKFRKETGKTAIITTIKEGFYRSGLPKKTKVEQYHPDYARWLENILLKLGS